MTIDQWGSSAAMKIDVTDRRRIVFPGSPLAATKEELQLTGFWPDIEKSAPKLAGC